MASDKLSGASRDAAAKLRLGGTPTPRSRVARMTKRLTPTGAGRSAPDTGGLALRKSYVSRRHSPNPSVVRVVSSWPPGALDTRQRAHEPQPEITVVVLEIVVSRSSRISPFAVTDHCGFCLCSTCFGPVTLSRRRLRCRDGSAGHRRVSIVLRVQHCACRCDVWCARSRNRTVGEGGSSTHLIFWCARSSNWTVGLRVLAASD